MALELDAFAHDPLLNKLVMGKWDRFGRGMYMKQVVPYAHPSPGDTGRGMLPLQWQSPPLPPHPRCMVWTLYPVAGFLSCTVKERERSRIRTARTT